MVLEVCCYKYRLSGSNTVDIYVDLDDELIYRIPFRNHKVLFTVAQECDCKSINVINIKVSESQFVNAYFKEIKKRTDKSEEGF